MGKSWGQRMDAQMKASKAQTGTGRMSGRVNQDNIRKQCTQCNGGWVPFPKSMRTTKKTRNADGEACGWCGGDGYLDPGDKGYGK